MRLLLPLLSLLLAGCTHFAPPTPDDPRPIVNLVWSDAFDHSAVSAWDDQIAKRWPGRKCVVLFCHGLDEPNPPFRLIPDKPLKVVPAENTVRVLRALYPDRLLVLVSCNPSHEMLHTPGVAFSPWDVWIKPGADVRPVWTDGRFEIRSDAGSIDKFVVNEMERK